MGRAEAERIHSYGKPFLEKSWGLAVPLHGSFGFT